MRENIKRGAPDSLRSWRGFTLLETMVALSILLGGLLSVAYLLGASLNYMSISQSEFICQQKASEAVESIFTARNTQLISWPQIDNVSNGGIFTDGPQPLLDPGPDGIVGTADDNAALPDAIIGPGPDGILGTADDTQIVLSNFTRQIVIQDNLFNNPNLKQITVTVVYKVGAYQRTYTLVSYISAYS
jgi:prepilin-type N-terminal cleavage/methylation domain-containing protein